MTVLVASVFGTVALLFSGFLVRAGDVTVARIRAQAAADAGALAAVAEGAGYGRGGYGAQARIYVERNGGHLDSCDCRNGAYEVQVTATVDGVAATARAEIDPAYFSPAATVSSDGLHPRLDAAVRELLAATEGSVQLVSGFREPGRQLQLWNQALARYGDPEIADDWVARPGHSMHEKGLAVDLGGDLDRAVAAIDSLDLPLYRPLPHEPWHFELVGSRG